MKISTTSLFVYSGQVVKMQTNSFNIDEEF